LKQFLISQDIICVEHDKKTVFNKDSIFAIHLFNGENYRFIQRSPCFIADTSYLYIYEYETIKTEYKISGPHRRENKIPVTYYYFSFGNHHAVLLLTLANLCKYVLTNPNASSILSSKFMTDDMLSEINQQTGHFKVNELIISILEK
jgi:hypothetical protein